MLHAAERSRPVSAVSCAQPLIVGYQNKSLAGNSAFNLSVATFKAVGKDADAMTLGDIGASEGWMTGDDQVKTLTANGAVDQAYTYINATDAADWGCSKGWYLTADVKNESIIDLTPYLKNSEPLPLGNGLLVLVGSGTTTLTYAGEVISGDTPISLKGNSAFNITGNVSPVDIILGDIGASEGWMTGDDQVKTLTANGAVDQAYT